MELCSDDCTMACDFCKFCDYDKEEEFAFCDKLNKEVQLGSYCEHFYCFRVDV